MSKKKSSSTSFWEVMGATAIAGALVYVAGKVDEELPTPRRTKPSRKKTVLVTKTVSQAVDVIECGHCGAHNHTGRFYCTECSSRIQWRR